MDRNRVHAYIRNMARKHIQAMNQTERAFIHGFIRNNAARALDNSSIHFEDRASERHFSIEDAVEALRGGLVVEVHNDAKADFRALVRNAAGTCVVVSLVTFRVITVYYNAPSDAHDTLNWNAYRWNQDVAELVKGLRRAA